MREYTERRDGTPLAREYWGTLPDPRQEPISDRDQPVGFAVGIVLSSVMLAGVALIGAIQFT